MSLSLRFKSTGSAQSGELIVDVVNRLDHTRDSEVTEHPVEQGAAVTDHCRTKSDQIVIDGLVTDYPLGGTPQPGRANDTYAQLGRLQDAGTLITATSATETYENVVVRNLRKSDDSKTEGAVRFSFTLHKIRIVQTQTVAALTRSRLAKGKGKVDGGRKTTTPADPQERSRSFALQIGQGVGLLEKYLPPGGLAVPEVP